MKIYIRKVNDKKFVIYKESFLKSIISDFITALVMILLIGLDILFALMVEHSILIDFIVVISFIFYMIGFMNQKEETKTQEEFNEIVDEIFKNKKK